MQRHTLFVLPLSLSFAALPAVAASVDVSNCKTAAVWQDAFNKGDGAAIAALYTPDAIEVLPSGIRVGPAAVQQRVDDEIKHGETHLAITSTKCDLEGTTRVSAGDWKSDTPQGPLSGFWTAIERNNGSGTWKMLNLTVNITPPPAKQ